MKIGMRQSAHSLALLSLLAACAPTAGGGYVPAGQPNVNPRFVPDGGTDAGPRDVGAAGQDTAAPIDVGSAADGVAKADSGALDGGQADAGQPDGGAPDSGPLDAGQPDAGSPDAGADTAGGCPADCPNGPQCLAWSKPETCNGKDDDCNGNTDDGACQDGDDCTIDACDPGTGCKHIAMPEGQACGVNKVCSGGVCTTIASGPVNPTPGALVITEFMANPATVNDAVGEWFEIHNPGPSAIKLDGLVIADAAGKTTVSAAGLQIPAAGWFVFGRNDDASSNGGVPVQHAYGTVTLNNTSDTLRLELADGTLIDQVAYTPEANGWPKLGNGASYRLSSGKHDAIANDFGGNWCLGVTTFGAGDLGTPGKSNGACP